MEKREWGSSHLRARPSISSRRGVAALAVLLLLVLYLYDAYTNLRDETLSAIDRVQKCAIDNLHDDLSFLDPAKPITSEEFIDRRDRLARALEASEMDGFVLEPGYTFQ